MKSIKLASTCIHDKIDAIKAVRQFSNYGLKESKEFVEAVDDGEILELPTRKDFGDVEINVVLKKLEDAGFQIVEIDNAEQEIIDDLGNIAIKCVQNKQYDMAEKLINLLNQYNPA